MSGVHGGERGLLRAIRLVVDTGIHHYKWDREKTYKYMQDNQGWASYDSIDRYIVWPGQACSYKIGEIRILALKEKAKKALGDDFDIKAFHRAITEYGSVPLDILDEIVDEFIATQ